MVEGGGVSCRVCVDKGGGREGKRSRQNRGRWWDEDSELKEVAAS